MAGEVIVRVFYYVGNQIKKNAKPKDGSLEGVGEELHIASDSEFISLHDLVSVELVQTKDFGLLVRAQAATSTVWFNVPRVFNMGGKPITHQQSRRHQAGGGDTRALRGCVAGRGWLLSHTRS